MPRYLCQEAQENVSNPLHKRYDIEHTQSSEALQLCCKSLDKNWHRTLREHAHVRACLCLQIYIKTYSLKVEVWGDIPEVIQHSGFSKPSFIKDLEILQVKNALEMQTSLCSKELFLLSFERNGI